MSELRSDTCAICGRGGTPLGDSVHPECARWGEAFIDEDEACEACDCDPYLCELGGEA